MKKNLKMLILGIILSHSLLFCAQHESYAQAHDRTVADFYAGEMTDPCRNIIRYVLNNPQQFLDAKEHKHYFSCNAEGRSFRWEIDSIPGVTDYLEKRISGMIVSHPERDVMTRFLDEIFCQIFRITKDNKLLTEKLPFSVSEKLRITNTQLENILEENRNQTQVPPLDIRHSQVTLEGIIPGGLPPSFLNFYSDLFKGREGLKLMKELVIAGEYNSVIDYPMSPEVKGAILDAGIVDFNIQAFINYCFNNLDAFILALLPPTTPDLPFYGSGRVKWSIDNVSNATKFLDKISEPEAAFLAHMHSPFAKIQDLQEAIEKLNKELQKITSSGNRQVITVLQAHQLSEKDEEVIKLRAKSIPVLEINPALKAAIEKYKIIPIQEYYASLYLERAALQCIVNGARTAQQVFAQYPISVH